MGKSPCSFSNENGVRSVVELGALCDRPILLCFTHLGYGQWVAQGQSKSRACVTNYLVPVHIWILPCPYFNCCGHRFFQTSSVLYPASHQTLAISPCSSTAAPGKSTYRIIVHSICAEYIGFQAVLGRLGLNRQPAFFGCDPRSITQSSLFWSTFPTPLRSMAVTLLPSRPP